MRDAQAQNWTLACNEDCATISVDFVTGVSKTEVMEDGGGIHLAQVSEVFERVLRFAIRSVDMTCGDFLVLLWLMRHERVYLPASECLSKQS